MSDIIPNIPFSKFRLLKARDLKRLKSAEITSDGEHLFLFVNCNIGDTDIRTWLKSSTENSCQATNAIGGEYIEDLTKEVSNVV